MIRAATAVDAAAVAALWNHYIRDTLVTFNWEEKTDAEVAGLIESRQAAGHGFLVASEGAGLAGFATYAQFRSGVGYAHTMEHTILLDVSARGRGVGRALMAATEDHARCGGACSLFAGGRGASPEGRAFHPAAGCAEVASAARSGGNGTAGATCT